GGDDDEQEPESPRADRADVLRPFADLHADEIGAQSNPDGHESDGQEDGAVIGEMGVRGAKGENARAHIEHGGAGEPEGNPDPIDDEGEEAVPRTEIVARPEIKAARARVLS